MFSDALMLLYGPHVLVKVLHVVNTDIHDIRNICYSYHGFVHVVCGDICFMRAKHQGIQESICYVYIIDFLGHVDGARA